MNLKSVCSHLSGIQPIPKTALDITHARQSSAVGDLSDIREQFQGKRALEVAAVGGHNLLMIGPSGTGKTMLPPREENEAFESATVLSISEQGFGVIDPFRSPYHTSSAVALIGGGSIPRPGEVSLADRGVLFLDELPEFAGYWKYSANHSKLGA